MVCVSDQREYGHYNMIKLASSPGGRLEVMDDAKDIQTELLMVGQHHRHPRHAGMSIFSQNIYGIFPF